MKEKPFQVMPELDSDEYRSLKKSIKGEGVQNPVHVDEEGNIIDGHHRVEACEELGIDDYPVTVHTDLSDREKLDKAYELNMQQRHLGDSQKQDIIREYLIELDETDDYQPDASVANTLGVSETWVREIRHRLEESGNIQTDADISGGGRRTERSREQKREEVEAALRDDPNQSNRKVAEKVGVSHPWVGDIRREMEGPHSIEISIIREDETLSSSKISLDDDMVESLEERLESSQYDTMEDMFKAHNSELVNKTPEELKPC